MNDVSIWLSVSARQLVHRLFQMEGRQTLNDGFFPRLSSLYLAEDCVSQKVEIKFA